MKELTASLTSTPNDIEEVTNLIQTNMMPEQLRSIDDMNMTFQDMVKRMDELGISFRFRGHWETPESTSEREQGLIQLEDASTSNSSVTSNSPGEDDGERWSHMIPTGLLDVLISYLQERR